MLLPTAGYVDSAATDSVAAESVDGVAVVAVDGVAVVATDGVAAAAAAGSGHGAARGYPRTYADGTTRKPCMRGVLHTAAVPAYLGGVVWAAAARFELEPAPSPLSSLRSRNCVCARARARGRKRGWRFCPRIGCALGPVRPSTHRCRDELGVAVEADTVHCTVSVRCRSLPPQGRERGPIADGKASDAAGA